MFSFREFMAFCRSYWVILIFSSKLSIKILGHFSICISQKTHFTALQLFKPQSTTFWHKSLLLNVYCYFFKVLNMYTLCKSQDTSKTDDNTP